MYQSTDSRNPFLTGMMGSLAATVAVFAAAILLLPMLNLDPTTARMISLAAFGGCAYMLSDNLMWFLAYEKKIRQNPERRPDREEFLCELKASGFTVYNGISIAVTAFFLFVLLMLQSIFGNNPGIFAKKVSLDDLAGSYRLVEIKGKDSTNDYIKIMQESGIEIVMKIDQDGYAGFGYGGMILANYRFFPGKMKMVEIQNGKETGRGGSFTLKNGTLTINNKLILQKIEEDTSAP